jgi:hypothetical protein
MLVSLPMMAAVPPALRRPAVLDVRNVGGVEQRATRCTFAAIIALKHDGKIDSACELSDRLRHYENEEDG